MKTFVVNLLGGSGLGKSTTAALVYGEMKLSRYSVELVREFVKEWAWAGRKVGPLDQGIIYGNQLEREKSLYNKVEFIITDSPLILSAVYQKFYTGNDPIKATVLRDLETAKEHNVEHLNILLRRSKPYDPNGRYETEEQAKQVDIAVEQYLKENNLPCVIVEAGDRERVTEIVNMLGFIHYERN